jgi:putative ABC transport system permease protein
MNAVISKVVADLRRRKLQTIVIAVVIFLSSGAATLALNLLVETDAPYDHAFAAARGAHLTLTYAADQVTAAQLRRTASTQGVTAAAGPWPSVEASLSPMGGKQVMSFQKGGGSGVQVIILFIVGRTRPDTAVDRLTIESGRWVTSPGEIVLSQRTADELQLQPGDTLQATRSAGHTVLRVVGIAASVSPYTDGWVIPRQIPALVIAKAPLQYQMLYRVTPSSTDSELRHASQAIVAHLSRGAVVSEQSYLTVKLDADRLTAVMIPFLLAFSAFALLASGLIIANVVSGVVIAGYREIGIMKSVGFAPRQVMMVIICQIIAPTLAGVLAGVAAGTIGSQPFLQDTAHAFNLPAPFTASITVELAVLTGIVGIAALSAAFPSWRASRMSAVAAITIGSAPAAGSSSKLARAIADFPLPRPITLGLAEAFARPLRSAMTVGAITVGVASVVFALGLRASLRDVAQALIRDQPVPVTVNRSPLAGDRTVTAFIRRTPGTAHFVAERQANVVVPGIAEPIPYIAYRGASSWIGFAMIDGRWFSRSGEVVAPSAFIDQTHLKVGDSFAARLEGRSVRLKLVGEILDQQGNDLLLRGGWGPLAAANPHAQPDQYDIGLQPGTNPDSYANQLSSAAGPEVGVYVVEHATANTSFLLLETVIGGLALVLIVISVAGVFNTVVLTTREKTRDIAILKSVGMTPAQVTTMVVASAALLGLFAGTLGLPAGLELQRQILTIMGQIASDTRIPAAFFDTIDHRLLLLLGLSGVAIAGLGSFVPARWAAAIGVADVLQSE